jgi:hypothetical protein
MAVNRQGLARFHEYQTAEQILVAYRRWVGCEEHSSRSMKDWVIIENRTYVSNIPWRAFGIHSRWLNLRL